MAGKYTCGQAIICEKSPEATCTPCFAHSLAGDEAAGTFVGIVLLVAQHCLILFSMLTHSTIVPLHISGRF